jgi:predicted Zn-dependent peptidase
VLIGYHKTSISHPDDVVFDVISDIVGSGRTARLFKALVKEKRVAMSATAFAGTPGYKYPGLYVFYAVPMKGHTNKECEEAIYAEIERLKDEPVTTEELERARTRARAGLIRSLNSNYGLAGQLAFYAVAAGNWRHLFWRLERIDRIDARDIQRVAKDYFIAKNRTVGMIETIPTPKQPDQEPPP